MATSESFPSDGQLLLIR